MTDQLDPLALADWLEEQTLSLREHYDAAAELRRLSVSEREGWRYADELEQERKRLETANAELLEALKSVMYWDNGKPEWEEARAAIAKQGGAA